ncbi:hypothetical protein RKD23_003918 [Streptomyces sp. SAI-170]
MRSLLTALLRFLLPPRGRHRADVPAPSIPPRTMHVPSPHPDVVFMDGHPLVRPYLDAWDRVPLEVAV